MRWETLKVGSKLRAILHPYSVVAPPIALPLRLLDDLEGLGRGKCVGFGFWLFAACLRVALAK